MGIINSLRGSVRVELTGADIENSLRTINGMEIPVFNICQISDITVQFTIMRRHMGQIKKIVDHKGDHMVIRSYKGIFWKIRGMKRRPVFLFGVAVLTLLVTFIPSRVLFVKVEGNERIPEQQILEAARDIGIGFGESRRAVRSEKVKNSLLGTLPELQWAGVNTYGCTAVISVRERDLVQQQQQYTVSHTIACRDGVITSCVVTDGTGLCSEGQAVQKGQILISGYMDCGGVITAGRGQGEIFAQTRRRITAVTPAEAYIRGTIQDKQTRYSLLIGKKRINFYKGSGIYDGSCVKMVTQYHLTLPGDYVLPITLIKETSISHRCKMFQMNEAQVVAELSRFAANYIHASGVALTVHDEQETVLNENGRVILDGIYNCTEMIGREQGVEIGDFHGKTD